MNPLSHFLAITVSLLALLPLGQAQNPEAPTTTEPSGHYLVTLELAGEPARINVEVQGKTVKCVKSTIPELEGMEGEIITFRTQGRVLPGVESGGYLVRMRNANRAMSQIWIFRKDGRAAVREIPDRGEMQSAIPVKDDTLELTK